MSNPATARWPNSRRVGHVVFQRKTTGKRHRRPKQKRSVRKVKGGAYCSPILVAR
jgi:hypothetical protein